MIVAYKPTFLFTKNRPPPIDSVWDQYPIWNDALASVSGFGRPTIPVVSLLTIEENYIMWRYEYVLVDISKTLHLADPGGHVPAYSRVVRDNNGKVVGKARFTGYFV